MSNLYEILEISKDASIDDIKKSYKRLARIHHPDKGGNEETFKKIGRAYEILSDESKRAQYDQLGDEGFEQSNNGNSSFNPHDLFSRMFGGRADPFGGRNPFGGSNFPGFPSFFNNQGPMSQKMNDHIYPLKISLKDAFTGLNKNIRITIERDCQKCLEKCKECHGQGQITRTVQNGFMTQIITHPCKSCSGKGMYPIGKQDCEICQGKSEWTDVKELKINIPPGVNKGYFIKCEGLGEQPVKENILPGDLIIEVQQIESDPYFVRQNSDLVYKVSLTFAESIIGKEIVVPCFDGDYRFHTKEIGIIGSGIKHVIENRGMNVNNKRGNLIVVFDVIYPSGALDENIRQVFVETFEKINMS